jgi:phthiodiolone/phenolphthiodiolone dimycocerosates ketoreductase
MPTFQATIVAAPSEREARALLDHPMIRYMGLLLPASAWAETGHEHPFGPGFGGFVDIFPESYSEPQLRAAMTAMPVEELAEAGLIWGTPDRIIARLREYVAAGMRYVVPQLPAMAISRRDALYQVRVLHMIRRAFR